MVIVRDYMCARNPPHHGKREVWPGLHATCLWEVDGYQTD